MHRVAACCLALAAGLAAAAARAEPALKALIVDGQNNHKWQETTPVLKQVLEGSGLFAVDVATSPAKGQDNSGFQPQFGRYHVVVSNYNGEEFAPATKQALLDYVRSGGGFVVVHAANNAFGKWAEYNTMIGLGGWGGRTDKTGSYARFRDGKVVLDTSPGRVGSHGTRHAFQIVVRDPQHPITAGLPLAWMHNTDELYDSLRGPAENLQVLATAWSDPATRGTGLHEPMLMTIAYGQGRVFHTTLGHDVEAMRCVGFRVTLVRGTEWAATGKVTQTAVPPDFPTAEKVSLRD